MLEYAGHHPYWPHSNGATSVRGLFTTSAAWNVDPEEPCFIAKSVSYTHERVHWVNAVRNDPVVKEQVVRVPFKFLICRYHNLHLRHKKTYCRTDVSFMDVSNWITRLT